MAHNGIDIDVYILLTIIPAAAFFSIGYIAKRTKMQQALTYTLQAIICFAFSAAYFVSIQNGGAQGLAIVLALFGALLLFMARKHKIQPEEKQSEV